jgi:hypothetical protein
MHENVNNRYKKKTKKDAKDNIEQEKSMKGQGHEEIEE